MNFSFSRRSQFGANIFNQLNDKKLARMEKGLPVYNLSIGTPDFAPDAHVMEAAAKAALVAENYKYSLTELPALIKAVQGWYIRRFGVELAREEITSVYGSQEGIAHIAMALCDPGEIILVPSPCYPIFSIGPALCGARVEYYKLDPANDWQPDLDGIDPEIAKAAKAIIVSFPNNPTCSILPDSFYRKLIEFANKYEIIVIHDNAYSEIYFDGNKPGSFLAYPGAKEVGVEFNSLSKTYNLTGARLSFLLGNAEIVGRFRDVRSQIDYGSFLPGQYAAIAALEGPQDSVDANRAEYQRRRDALCSGLDAIGWKGVSSKATMFAWAPLPAGHTDSAAFCAELIERSGVICTPGAAFGPDGEGHVRFALVLPTEKITEAIRAIDDCGILKK